MNSKHGESLPEALRQAVEMTFMDMAFVDVIPSQEKKDIHHSNILFISFSQPKNGGMILRLSKECKKMIVENIHGSNWESLTSDEIDDCLLELLNVLAGNFLNSYCGREISHNMSFPQILFDEKEVADIEQYHVHYFDAEGVIFRVDIRIENAG